jgi:hypothetical protein
MTKKTTFPANLVSAVLTASFGLISIVHVIANRPILFVYYWLDLFGYDFRIFFMAAENILHGLSPYAVAWNYNRYVYTPIPALATIVLVPLGFDTGRVLLYFLIPAALVVGYLAVSSAFRPSPEARRDVLMAGLACLLFGYPFYFLVHSENIDGWLFLFLCLGLFFSEKERMQPWSGFFLSLAIAFKIYPVLIMVPLFLHRKWRLLSWTGAWLAIWAAISFPWHSGFRTSLAGRLTDFQLESNGSLYATMLGFQNLFGALGLPVPDLLMKYPTEIAEVIFGALILLVMFADYRLGRQGRYQLASATMYVPFMIAWPKTVYPYAFVVCTILIPTAVHLWGTSRDRTERLTLCMLAIGIALSQWQSFALANLTQNDLEYAVPGLGLLITMAAVAAHKCVSLRPLTQPNDRLRADANPIERDKGASLQGGSAPAA